MTDLQSLITAAETGTTEERAKALCELGGMALELAKEVEALKVLLARTVTLHKDAKYDAVDHLGGWLVVEDIMDKNFPEGDA